MLRKIIPMMGMLIAVVAVLSFAVETEHRMGVNFAYYFDDNRGQGVGSSGFLLPSYVPRDPPPGWIPAVGDVGRSLGNGWGSVELEAYYRFKAFWPMLQGKGLLFSKNGLTLTVKPILAPVSLHVENELIFTPIAFFQLNTRLSVGTGWPFDLLNVQGLALNVNGDGTYTYVGGVAVVWEVGGTIQFDLGNVVDSEWASVVLLYTGRLRYQVFSKAGPSDPWVWRADGGRNFNGWYYKADYALGWRPPWKLDFIGIVGEHWYFIDHQQQPYEWTVAGGGWGSDYNRFRFGPAFNFDLGKDNALTLLIQFQNNLLIDGYNPAPSPPDTDLSVYNSYFINWKNATGSTYWEIDRIALAWSKKF